MSISKSCTFKVWHWIIFSPYNIIQNPISQILDMITYSKDIVIGSNYPDSSTIFSSLKLLLGCCGLGRISRIATRRSVGSLRFIPFGMSASNPRPSERRFEPCVPSFMIHRLFLRFLRKSFRSLPRFLCLLFLQQAPNNFAHHGMKGHRG